MIQLFKKWGMSLLAFSLIVGCGSDSLDNYDRQEKALRQAQAELSQSGVIFQEQMGGNQLERSDKISYFVDYQYYEYHRQSNPNITDSQRMYKLRTFIDLANDILNRRQGKQDKGKDDDSEHQDGKYFSSGEIEQKAIAAQQFLTALEMMERQARNGGGAGGKPAPTPTKI